MRIRSTIYVYVVTLMNLDFFVTNWNLFFVLEYCNWMNLSWCKTMVSFLFRSQLFRLDWIELVDVIDVLCNTDIIGFTHPLCMDNLIYDHHSICGIRLNAYSGFNHSCFSTITTTTTMIGANASSSSQLINWIKLWHNNIERKNGGQIHNGFNGEKSTHSGCCTWFSRWPISWYQLQHSNAPISGLN